MRSGLKTTKSRRGIKIGRPRKHGGYCLSFAQDALLKREHPLVRRYLEDTRDGLIRDVAGTEDQLTEQQRILIDRVISRLAICRLIEIYISKNGAFAKRGDKMLPELVPALGVNYLSYVNSIDRAVIALGLERKKAGEVLDLGRYLAAAGSKGPGEIADPRAPGRDVSVRESGQGQVPAGGEIGQPRGPQLEGHKESGGDREADPD